MPIRSGRRRALLGLLGLATGVAAGGFALQSQVRAEGAELLHETILLLSRASVEERSAAELYEAAAEGLVARLEDPYSELLSPEELERFRREALGNYGGTGMLIESVEGSPVVMQVYPGSPAAERGVRGGDRILAVGGVPVSDSVIGAVSERLRGRPGSEVTVGFGRAGAAPFAVSMTRRRIQVPSVPFATLVEGGVGYVPVRRFSEATGREVEAALRALEARGARSFVLDLRGNGGGALDQAIAVSNLFLPRGEEIAAVAYRNQPEERYVADREPLSSTAPLAVLIDGASASASEIVAGALQDHDRALVVGRRSFGKGLVQQLFPLDAGWVLKLTTGEWVTPSGRSLHLPRDPRGAPLPADSSAAPPVFLTDAGRTIHGGGGITPDLAVEPPPADPQVERLAELLGPHVADFHDALSATAHEQRGRIGADFAVDAAMREGFLRRMAAHGVEISPAHLAEVGELLDRLLAQRVADRVFGETAAFHRGLERDGALRAAVERLRGAASVAALLGLEPAVAG